MQTVEPSAGTSAARADDSADALGDHGHWQRTSPFAVLFFLGGVVKGLVANGAQLAASIGTLIVLLQQGAAMVAWGAMGLATWFGVAATMRYWFFRYALEEDRVRIRQGVVKKTELDVQFDRIQGVNVEQSLIFRLLGLVTVGFDTAGSAQQEGKLPAVSPRLATALRARIERKKETQPAPSAALDGAPASRGADAEESEQLVRLGSGDMVRIGLADRSVLAGLAFVPLMWQAFDNTIREWIETRVQHLATEFQELGLLAASLMVGGVLFFVLAMVVAATICSAFLRYHDFALFAAGGTGKVRFRSVRGLLTRKETAVERAKIQQLRLAQGLLFRRFGRFHLRALPAASGRAAGQTGDGGDHVLHVPALATEAVRPLAARVFAEEGEGLSLLPAQDAFARISPAYIEARLKTVGLAPALVALAALYPFLGAISFLSLAWLPATGLVAWQLWRRRGYMHTDDALATRAGLLGFKVDAFLFRKVQAVLVRQSPLQRRRGLATLNVVLASGMATLPYIDHAVACRLRDYMLYKVESSRGPWH